MSAEQKLIVRHGSQVREVLLVGTVSVGRNPSCEISAADPQLSREHAEFRATGRDVSVRDLGSRNGTKVNGKPVKEQALVPGDRIEIGPLMIEFVSTALPAPVEAEPAGNSDDEATVVLPRRQQPASRPAPAPAPVPPPGPPRPAAAPPEPPPVPAPRAADLGPPRPVSAAAAPARDASPARFAARQPAAPVPEVPPVPDLPIRKAPAPQKPAAVTGTARPGMSFSKTALLWVVPVALASFVLGFLPSLLEREERGPLLAAQYDTLSAAAGDLVARVADPGGALDAVAASLRGYPGVVLVRIAGPDGRVIAPTAEGGTVLDVPDLGGATSKVLDAGNGSVEIVRLASTGDGSPLLVKLAVDPSRILAPPAPSPAGPLFLVASLLAAYLAARRLSGITDARLSRLGEEIELMTTGQQSGATDPFTLRGSQRVIDAATFLVSQARAKSAGASAVGRPSAAGSVADDAVAEALVTVDGGYRIVDAGPGSQALLGLAPAGARGTHLIDALTDQAVADEVLRLVALAAPGRPATGEAAPGHGAFQLAIEVTRDPGAAPVSIRFRRH